MVSKAHLLILTFLSWTAAQQALPVELPDPEQCIEIFPPVGWLLGLPGSEVGQTVPVPGKANEDSWFALLLPAKSALHLLYRPDGFSVEVFDSRGKPHRPHEWRQDDGVGFYRAETPNSLYYVRVSTTDRVGDNPQFLVARETLRQVAEQQSSASGLDVVEEELAYVRRHPDWQRSRWITKGLEVRSQRARKRDLYQFRPVFSVRSTASPAAGTGFLIQADSKILGVTAIHPHGEAKPTAFFDLRGRQDVPRIDLGKTLHRWDDIQVLECHGGSRGLAFRTHFLQGSILAGGDALAIVLADGIHRGTLHHDGHFIPGETPIANRLKMNLKEPIELRGGSGAPIILDATGEVIGVAQGYVKALSGTDVYFQPLDLKVAVRKPPVPESYAFFGMDAVETTPAARAAFRAPLFPLDLQELTLGASIETLRERRGRIRFQPTSKGWLSERFPAAFSYSDVVYKPRFGRLHSLHIAHQGRVTPKDRQAATLTVDWLDELLGRAERAAIVHLRFLPAVKPNGMFGIRWRAPEFNVDYRARLSGDRIDVQLSIVPPEARFPGLDTAKNQTVIDTQVAALPKVFRRWLISMEGTPKG